MKKRIVQPVVFVLLLGIFMSGCAMVGIKQLGRNNLSEEEIASVLLPCFTTRQEVERLYRVPTDDFRRKQGDYDVYIYKGFAGRAQFETQTLEILINGEDVVANYRLNDTSGEPMADLCM